MLDGQTQHLLGPAQHFLQNSSEVKDVVHMTAIAVVDAQEADLGDRLEIQ